VRKEMKEGLETAEISEPAPEPVRASQPFEKTWWEHVGTV
jgi:hypothetical protein